MIRFLFVLIIIVLGISLSAQPGPVIMTEAEPAAASTVKPLDDVVARTSFTDRTPLPYEPIREADIFWEKRIWRVIDTREKMNQVFRYPEMPFIKILLDNIKSGNIQAYSTEDDKFSYPLSPEEIEQKMGSSDTIEITNPETYEIEYRVVNNDLNYEDIKRFRIKEMWFFDSKLATMRVRILGIAPLMEVYDDFGNLRYETPMFWVHYPSIRPVLAKQAVFNPFDGVSRMSWEDWMEMRFFSSYIYKESNVHDLRIEDLYSGVDALMEGEKIKQEIFNFEHDLWEY